MRTIVAGNWKMHKDRSGAKDLIAALVAAKSGLPSDVDVIIAPPYPFLGIAVDGVKGSAITVAAQNCHHAAQGAYTGEVSAAMLASMGVTACLVGHSERRQYFGETDVLVAQKVKALLEAGITPIYCCGEKQEERTAGRHFEVVSAQMQEALGACDPEQLMKVVVAYEPVWAIGTGLTATAAQAQEMHAHIRELLRNHGDGVAATVPVLYGGSCKPDNAAELFAGPDVNGGLIGGAALDADQFLSIIRAAGNS